MAEFKQIKDKTVVEATVDIQGVLTKGLFVHDVSLVTDADIAIQKDRILRNDEITEALFVYVRELRALVGPDVPIVDVVERLRNVIIADYPTQVRDV